MKLNLGCDMDYRTDFINLDRGNKMADVDHDLNNFPYPFNDSTFSYVLASHVIEHLDDIPKVMTEIARIMKKGGTFDIRVPYFNSYSAFRDPTHKHYFTYESFSFFTGEFKSNSDCIGFYTKALFKEKEKRLVWANSNKPIVNTICKVMNKLVNLFPYFLERRFTWLIPIESMHIKLEKI